MYSSVITHASSLMNFIKWLSKNKKSFRMNLEDWILVFKEWRESNSNERKREQKKRKMNRFEKVSQLKEIREILKSFEKTLQNDHIDLPYNDQLAMTLFVINAATNNRPGPYLNMTREDFESGQFRDVVVGVEHKTSYKFDVGVKIKEQHKPYVQNLHEKFWQRSGQLPRLCFPNINGNLYTTFANDFTKLCQRKFGTEFDVNITVVRKVMETFIDRNPSFLGTSLSKLLTEQSGHDGDTAKKQYVVPNSRQDYEKLLQKYQDVLYGDHDEEQVLADAADLDTEISKNQEGDEPPPEIATAPAEISVPVEAGKTLENKSLASVKRRHPLRNDARNKIEKNDKTAEFSDSNNSNSKCSDDIESDKDSHYSEYGKSYASKGSTKRLRCNKSSSSVSTRIGSEQARNAYIRALKTYRQAKTLWIESEKVLIDEFLDIEVLPTKNKVKETAEIVAARLNVKFLENQIERCYQIINHAFNKIFGPNP